jgi:hypothetical protein
MCHRGNVMDRAPACHIRRFGRVALAPWDVLT